MRERDDHLHLKVFPKKYFIPAHCIISSWWTHLLEGFGHYVIQPRAIQWLMVTTNNIMNMGYTYAITRLKNTPDIILTITHFRSLST